MDYILRPINKINVEHHMIIYTFVFSGHPIIPIYYSLVVRGNFLLKNWYITLPESRLKKKTNQVLGWSEVPGYHNNFDSHKTIR